MIRRNVIQRDRIRLNNNNKNAIARTSHCRRSVGTYRIKKKCCLGHFYQNGENLGRRGNAPGSKLWGDPAAGQPFAPHRFLPKIGVTTFTNPLFQKLKKLMKMRIKGVFQPTKFRRRVSNCFQDIGWGILYFPNICTIDFPKFCKMVRDRIL